MYKHQHINNNWSQINTEYYGIKKNLYYDFANSCGYNMESHEYCKNKQTMPFPQTFSNNIKINA